ncbi:helix-turn-helix transcriptional regulator [Paracoccus onubensis]|uniref:helix-turn-helix domain-containing protein n=1 Tax=Paracoccus onubensis TaxID=1675788 RepID=UPI00272EF782|nr:helix-turn-helix transcriptional regulator [Paracoccus onubensis]MDP0929030.1 helix-turn-helix transcriptional regulator [Paracoccus onubensis]
MPETAIGPPQISMIVCAGSNMTIEDAIIAPNVNQKCFDNRKYTAGAKSATNPAMEKIDRNWIKARLIKMGRGSQARLAEHLGISTNKMSKIMSGTREIQQDEIPKVLSFFNARIVTADDYDQSLEEILRGASRLNNDGKRLLRRQLKEILQTPSLVQPSEGTLPDESPDSD